MQEDTKIRNKNSSAKIISREFVARYRDLNVYKIVFKLALAIHKKSLEFPKIEQYALADQLRRSSKSICANIAEGFARQRDSKAEWRRFLIIALGSCEETLVWIDFAVELRYIDKELHAQWVDELDKAIRMLHKLRDFVPS